MGKICMVYVNRIRIIRNVHNTYIYLRISDNISIQHLCNIMYNESRAQYLSKTLYYVEEDIRTGPKDPPPW